MFKEIVVHFLSTWWIISLELIIITQWNYEAKIRSSQYFILKNPCTILITKLDNSLLENVSACLFRNTLNLTIKRDRFCIECGNWYKTGQNKRVCVIRSQVSLVWWRMHTRCEKFAKLIGHHFFNTCRFRNSRESQVLASILTYYWFFCCCFCFRDFNWLTRLWGFTLLFFPSLPLVFLFTLT